MIWKFRTFFTLGLLGVTVFSASALGQNGPEQALYRLGPGDTISIDVFGEEDLSMEIRLDDRGVIDYPFLGTLAVRGLTVIEVRNLLLDGLKGPYLVDPDITVAITQYRSVYVNGEVENPGSFPYEPGITVEKAIAMAGGFTERAARGKITINRADKESTESVKAAITDSIRPGDIITVPQSFF